jgi:hypothetical protein
MVEEVECYWWIYVTPVDHNARRQSVTGDKRCGLLILIATARQ